MGLLAWNDWHRSDACKALTDNTYFAGVSLATMLYAGMRKVFLDEQGNQGLLYRGDVMRAARIIRAADSWNRWGYTEGDMSAMLQHGNYSFGSIFESTTLKIDVDNDAGTYGMANESSFLGESNTINVNFRAVLALATTPVLALGGKAPIPQTAEGVSLLTDLLMGEVMHELMHTQGFTHKPSTGPADESFGSIYFLSLCHLAKLSVLAAGGRWDFWWNFWGTSAGIKGGDYPQLMGLHSLNTVNGASWRPYETIEGKVAPYDLGALNFAVDIPYLYAHEAGAPLRFAPRRLAERWWTGQWEPVTAWKFYPPPDGMHLDAGLSAVTMNKNISVFATSGGKVQHTYYSSAGWSPWIDCQSPVAVGGVSAVAVPGQTRIDLFIRGTDSMLWQGDFQGLDQPFHWHPVDKNVWITTPPAAIALNADSRHVFAMDEHGVIGYKAWRQETGWLPWVSIGGSCVGRVGAVALADTCQIDVYCRGLDSRLWQCWWNGDAWSGWSPHNDGQVMTTSPSVTSLQQDERSVYFVSADGEVVRKQWKRDQLGQPGD